MLPLLVVVLPTLFASFYASYRDVFGGGEVVVVASRFEMKLPDFSDDAAPEFVDAVGCKEWLETVPLANVPAAQRELLGELEEFNRFAVKPSERLAVMETLREAVHFVQVEQVKKFSNRALPMTEAEAAAFDDANELWEQMQTGYSHCLESALAGEGGVKSQAALICQRVLAYVGLKMFYCYRAYRQVPAHDWRALHEAYAYAEQLERRRATR